MKNLTELKKQIKNYFNYMFENKSREEIAKYNHDSFLDFETFLEEIKSRFVRNININDFSDDEISVAYDSAIEELLNLN